jgi:hypothetical protein
MLARFIADERQHLKIGFGDQALAGFGPFDELPNLSLCEAAACASTSGSEGFDRLLKAVRVAMTLGWGGRGDLFMPLMVLAGERFVKPAAARSSRPRPCASSRRPRAIQ